MEIRFEGLCTSCLFATNVPASSEEAKLLKVRTGFPILSIEVTYSDADGNPLEHLRANYRGDRFQFQLDF